MATMEQRVRDALDYIRVGHLQLHHHGVVRKPRPLRKFRFGGEFENIFQPHIMAHPSRVLDQLPAGYHLHKHDHRESDFAKAMVHNHNRAVKPPPETNIEMIDGVSRDPRIHQEGVPTWQYDKWLLTWDPTMARRETPPWGFELLTPILDPSTWDAVIDPTWLHLEKEYSVTSDERTSTYVHVSAEGGMLHAEDVLLIAIAVVWWEPAWEVLLPEARRGNWYTKSWRTDNPTLAAMSREKVIEELEKSTRDDGRPDPTRIMNLLQPDGTRYWGFNLRTGRTGFKTVEVRRPPASCTLAEVHTWIAVCVCFIMAAFRGGDKAFIMSDYEHSVAGLEQFILSSMDEPDSEYSTEGIFDKSDITRLFYGKRHLPMQEPRKAPPAAPEH